MVCGTMIDADDGDGGLIFVANNNIRKDSEWGGR